MSGDALRALAEAMQGGTRPKREPVIAERESVIDALGNAVRRKTSEFTEGMVGVPGTPYGELMNAIMAGGRSILPGGGSYGDEMQRVREGREERYPGAYSVIDEVRIPALKQALSDDMMSQAIGIAAPIAYHGSPHVFDRFSMQKIGTGEGAQAYGHGLYFTSEPKVAEQYRSGLTATRINLRDGVSLDAAKNQLIERMHALADSLSDVGQAQKTRRQANHMRKLDADMLPPHTMATIARDYGVKADDLFDAPPGAFYKVDIPDNLLDYEKPLHDQPDAAKWGAVQAMRLRGLPESDIQRALTDSSYSGAKVYRSVGAGDDRIASEALRKAGVPGHRYRGDSSGVENYVIYDDAQIAPLGRYPSMADYLAEAMKKKGTP